MILIVTAHFRERVEQRLPGVDPDALANGVWWAIENARTDLVRYSHRHVRPKGDVVRAFDFEAGRNTYRVVIRDETVRQTFITIHRNTENPR